MSQSYLDRFRSALPKAQGNQVLRILVAKRDSGEIKSVDEFKRQLQDLTKKILEDRIAPTFKLYKAVVGEDISSERYNEMLSRVYDDLEAAFIEADNIDTIIEAHHNLVNNVALKAIRFGVNELESRIDLYEFLNKSRYGFDSSLFNTFRESLNVNTSRTDSDAALIYVDPRTNESVLAEEDAQIDLVGERLILGADKTKRPIITEATWLSNSNSIRSELNVAFRHSKINNIIDNRNNTFWIEPILLKQPITSGVPMEVALRFGTTQDINFVEIEPASSYPMRLVGIDYFDASNTRRSTELSSAILSAPTRINFERIVTSCVVLRLKQENYQEIQFTKRLGELNFSRVLLGEHANVDKQAVSEDLNSVLTSDFILSDVFRNPVSTGNMQKYFEYILGFDNIRLGYSSYRPRSIYVSTNKEVNQLGQVGLRVSELRPVQTSGSSTISLEAHTHPARSSAEDLRFYHASVEYWLVAQHFASQNHLIATDILPLLPLGALRVSHEQLIFTHTSGGAAAEDAGQLRFYTEADSTDVVVYRNGTALTYGTDWSFIDSSDTVIGHLTVATAGAGRPMKRGIQILSNVRPLDIYTVSYTPTLSGTTVIPANTSLTKVVDLIGDQSARLVANNIVVFESSRGAYTIESSKLYLLVLMRRNSANQHFSPAVEEYMLVTGSVNPSKFKSVQNE